ncbi:MAG: type I-U CRISPR-associated helicase/endonuclease Cas3 [Rhodospirillales bacterium]|nr:type I-U CRISPR-associated helicase/endonuclease Cas3 [Rhodospirillales bacterium]
MSNARAVLGGSVQPSDPVRNPPCPTFTEFYRAINERDPFPWQVRLARYVASREHWPTEIGIPTGLGKTACLDIAVWWLASQSDRVPKRRTAQTRIWWVVNRRLLVDSTATHARAIASALRDPASVVSNTAGREIIERIAERLRALWVDPDAPPLDVISLRGGIASRTPTDPARPTVILCTLPMYGSRLLFRGYGSSRPPVDAAMAGTDSLVLLDEAHLAGHLRTLIPALAACSVTARKILGPERSGPTVVSLTATGDSAQGKRFDLDGEDEAHPVVGKRLDARKPVQVNISDGEIARLLAEAAVTLVQKASAPAASLVFSNTPKTARQAFQLLCEVLPEAEILLLTGRVREREAARIRDRILDPETGMASARAADAPREKHLIVVATQTLEVGADIDAEYLVTEACGVRALTQRLGRLNRLGRFPHARAVYVHVPPSRSRTVSGSATDMDTWAAYGTEPNTVLDRLLKSRSGSAAETVDLSPRSVASVLGPPLDDPGRAPEMLPGLLYEWTKTTTPPEGEAPVEPYFSGIAASGLSVSLLWRAHIPAPGRRLWPRGTDREAIDVPLAEAREALKEAVMCRLASDGITVEEVSTADFHPGDRIVVASDGGHMDRFGWNPAALDPVPDASLANLGLPLDAVSIKRLCGANLAGLVDTALGIADDDRDLDEAERSEAVSGIITILSGTPVPAGWEEAEWTGFVTRLRPRVLEPRNEVPRLLVDQPGDESLNDGFDELSLGPVSVELELHGHAVGTRARKVAERIGLPDDMLEVVERAAKLHDIGKADERFQRWLDPRRQSGPLLAKSNAPRHRWEAMRVSSGWPRGGRHEDLSARLVRAWLMQTPNWGTFLQRDLLIHLVISHHGKGRPLVPPATDGSIGSVCGVVEGVSIRADADLAIVDWEQPNRFRRLQDQLGPWGLALLECVVIRADHAVSAGVDGALEDS